MSFSLFYSGLAGLQANSSRLGVIGNNLANLNTIGFKSSRVTFMDIFSGSGGASFNGAGNPMQVGRGVQMGAIDSFFGQGSLQSTGLITDVSIQGQGFFVLADRDGARSFSRAGNFSFDADGNLVTPGGRFVQGWTTRDAAGNIPSSGALTNIQIPNGQTAPPRATTSVSHVTNLNADARVDNPATAGVDEAETYQTTMTVYDSLGSRHNMTFNFTPVDTNADGHLDQWNYTVTVEGDEVVGGTAGTPLTVASGTIAFDANGQLTAPAGNVTVNIPGWNNGSAAQSVTWELFDDAGGSIVTGYSSGVTATASTTQDGYGVGTLRTLTIDQEGLISGVFTNGSTLQLARIGLAIFNNPNGLVREGQNAFLETRTSGPATIGGAGSGGRGVAIANSLELSNVDVTQEFTELIVSERGYQASSRIITTTDQILQEALQLKR